MSITTFGQALAAIRVKRGVSYSDIVKTVIGLSRSDGKERIKRWEADDPTDRPSGYQLKGLYIMFPQLRHFTHLLPEKTMSGLTARVDVALSQVSDITRSTPTLNQGARVRILQETLAALPGDVVDPVDGAWLPPSAPPIDAQQLALPEPKTFPESLRQERVRAGLTQDELGELLDVTGPAISQWEIGNITPVEESWERLKSVFPNLIPPPDRKNMSTPVGPKGMTRPTRTNPLIPVVEAWRGRANEALTRATSASPLAVALNQALAELVGDPDVTARQLLAALNDAVALAEAVRRTLPVRVVEYHRAHPGQGGSADDAHRFEVDDSSHEAEPFSDPEPPMPELPGLAGLGVRYAAALQRHQREAEALATSRALYEDAKTKEELAKMFVDEAHLALVAAAAKPTPKKDGT
jgi:transcriptional regulator with XRE-family HTH domain